MFIKLIIGAFLFMAILSVLASLIINDPLNKTSKSTTALVLFVLSAFLYFIVII